MAHLLCAHVLGPNHVSQITIGSQSPSNADHAEKHSFQLFMTGLFALREAALLTLLMVPLLLFTLYVAWNLHTRFQPLATYVNLAQAAEVKRTQENGTTYEAGALASDVERLRKGHPVTMSQSALNRGRYRSKDERDDGLYVVKQDSKTDYIQPPMSQSFYGVLR